MSSLNERPLVVRRVLQEAARIRSYELVAKDGAELPPFEAGAHLIVHLPNGLARQYSLCNQPGVNGVYQVAVLRELEGRGGSACMHDEIKEGDVLPITGPENNFPLVAAADKHLLIGGGIGITPILAMVRHLHETGADFALHYCARSPEEAAFVAFLKGAPFADRVHFHYDGGDPSKGLDVAALLKDHAAGTHLYCCGPTGLMDAVRAASAHWPESHVHFESFKAAQSFDTADDQSFEVVLAKSGKTYKVPADQTILEVLEDNGHTVDSVCQEGICGACLTDVVEGEPEHRDEVLTDEERDSNKLMTICCSRSKSARLVLDL